jgi:hypothetical protein
LLRRCTLVVGVLGVVAIALLLAGVGQSGLNPVPVGPKADSSYVRAARVCRRVFKDATDQRRCVGLALDPTSSTLLAGDAPSVSKAAREGFYELIGWHGGAGWNTDGNNIVSWNYSSGLWGGSELSHWWQSAMALRTTVRYLERTDTTGPIYQQVLERTYRLEADHPLAIASSHFVNMYGDDTAWWGMAWTDASNYELRYAHDMSDAATFLRVAEYDARYLTRMPKQCGGVVWQLHYPTDTVTNAEYIVMMAQLYSYRMAPGPFHNPAQARVWLNDARSDLHWLEHSGLVNMQDGKVMDHMTRSCHTQDGPLTYTQGEMADALVQMGNALHDPSYYAQAAKFLNFATSHRSHMVTSSGIMQQPCEARKNRCVPADKANGALAGTPVETWLDQLSFKGILGEAIDDYTLATHSTRYQSYLHRNATAIVDNAIRNEQRRPGDCSSALSCQFVFYWAWPLNPSLPMLVSTATQMSALDVLIGALPASPAAGNLVQQPY